MLFEFELAVIMVIGKFNCFQNPYAGDPLTKIDWHDYKKIAEDEQRTGTSLYTASPKIRTENYMYMLRICCDFC